MKIEIVSPIIKEEGSNIKVIYTINELGNNKELWYLFPNTYKEYLTLETSDAVVVGMLLYAMEKGLDIVSETKISDLLLFKITKYLIPFLCKINSQLKPIKVDMPIYYNKFEGKHVGTGISCGIDSLSTVIYHGEEETISKYKIDTLTLLNTGYYGLNEDNSDNFKRYLKQSVEFCNENNYQLFSLDSNISNITHYNFLSAHTYLTCSALLLFQKYFNVYYYSSGYPIFNFKADFIDPAFYDVFLLDCISTNSLKFISSCTTMSRVEKTALITKHPNIFKSLYVCVGGDPSINCCKCEKCARTMLALESIGLTANLPFKHNKKIYKLNRLLYFNYMLRHKNTNVYYNEIYKSFKTNKINIPTLSWICFIPCPFELQKIKYHCKRIVSHLFRSLHKQ